jgi:hypothetical protein
MQTGSRDFAQQRRIHKNSHSDICRLLTNELKIHDVLYTLHLFDFLCQTCLDAHMGKIMQTLNLLHSFHMTTTCVADAQE